MNKIVCFLLLILSVNCYAQQELCTPQGAYGISFGKMVPPWKKPVSSTPAVKRFLIKPKSPDDRFDEYFVTVHRKNYQTYKIIATKYIRPVPTVKTGDLTPEAQQESRYQANEFVLRLIDNFDQDTKNKIIGFDERWEVDITENVRLTISIENYWTVNIECLDLKREAQVLKDFWK